MPSFILILLGPWASPLFISPDTPANWIPSFREAMERNTSVSTSSCGPLGSREPTEMCQHFGIFPPAQIVYTHKIHPGKQHYLQVCLEETGGDFFFFFLNHRLIFVHLGYSSLHSKQFSPKLSFVNTAVLGYLWIANSLLGWHSKCK